MSKFTYPPTINVSALAIVVLYKYLRVRSGRWDAAVAVITKLYCIQRLYTLS